MKVERYKAVDGTLFENESDCAKHNLETEINADIKELAQFMSELAPFNDDFNTSAMCDVEEFERGLLALLAEKPATIIHVLNLTNQYRALRSGNPPDELNVNKKSDPEIEKSGSRIKHFVKKRRFND